MFKAHLATRPWLCSAFLALSLLCSTHELAEAQCDQWVPGPPLNTMAGSSAGGGHASSFWDPDGDGPLEEVLVVGGEFAVAGGVVASNIAKWDGSSWSPLGPGFDGSVLALAVLDGDLVAAGSFLASGGHQVLRVARWDGAAWQPMGDGFNGAVRRLLIHQGSLYAGGFFTASGGAPTPYVARWDGNVWRALGAGPSRPAYSMATFRGELVAGSDNVIRSWNGTAWRTLSPANNNWLSVDALAVYQDELYAGGQSIGSNTSLQRFNGTTWTPVSAAPWSLSSGVQSLAVFGSELYIGGSMYHTGYDSPYLLRWNGMTIRSVGRGASHWVRSLLAHDNRLFAVGTFRSVNTTPANGVAALEGGVWRALGEGVGAAAVRSIVAFQDQVVLAGVIAAPDGGGSLASWDGEAVNYFGQLDAPDSVVDAMALFDGRLIVGGDFRAIGGVTASLIAAWDGAAWSALGAGLQMPMGGARFPAGVRAMTVHNK